MLAERQIYRVANDVVRGAEVDVGLGAGAEVSEEQEPLFARDCDVGRESWNGRRDRSAERNHLPRGIQDVLGDLLPGTMPLPKGFELARHIGQRTAEPLVPQAGVELLG